MPKKYYYFPPPFSSKLYIVFCVKESKDKSKIKASISVIFSTHEVKKSLSCVLKKRNDGSRVPILILCTSYFLMSVHYGGIFLGGSLWLYFQKLSWEYSEFTTFLGVNAGTIFIGCLTLVPILIIKFKMADMTLAILATLCNIVSGIFMLVTPYDNHWMPYIGTVFQLLSGIVSTSIKSTMTKIVQPDEITHVMAFLGMTLPFSIFGPPIFNLIYGASLSFKACNDVEMDSKDWCTGTFITVGLGFLLINIILYSYVRRYCQKRQYF